MVVVLPIGLEDKRSLCQPVFSDRAISEELRTSFSEYKTARSLDILRFRTIA